MPREPAGLLLHAAPHPAERCCGYPRGEHLPGGSFPARALPIPERRWKAFSSRWDTPRAQPGFGSALFAAPGNGAPRKGAWAGLSHELISFETLNPAPCDVPFPGDVPFPRCRGRAPGADSPACDTGNLLFHRRVRAREPPPGAARVHFSFPSLPLPAVGAGRGNSPAPFAPQLHSDHSSCPCQACGAGKGLGWGSPQSSGGKRPWARWEPARGSCWSYLWDAAALPEGELPLNAIQVLFEENDKTSFLIEGRLINSIRVTCPSYQDYQEWLYCLKTAQFRNADSSLSGSESFSGSKPPHPSQFTSSGRGSLSSDGRTNSWASAGRVATLTQLSQPSGSLPDGHAFLLLPEGWLLEEPLSPGYSQPLHCLAQPSWPSTALPTQDLRRGNSARKSKGKSSRQQLPNQDPERSGCGLIPANPNGELQSPVYHEPYAAHCPQQHPPAHLELGRFLQCHGQTGPAQGNPAVPAPQHPSLEHWNCREVPTAPTYSTPGTSRRLQLRAPAQGSYLGEISSLPEERLGPSLHPADGSGGTYGLADAACPCRDSSSYHDYAELQSFQSDLSYDNLWEAEEKELGTPCSSSSPAQQIYQV
ncbi:pleckstrin homology domain-containing family N member 1 isoform X2 [Corvus hawaiiensis]|uniref:pleckstrin homology domain-containing family N member 1 isoform X2 n=1 Tax=Corvus hawaiiensis TaxID=134902 RepID=UPI0020187F1A|nr:pleckstrin homology domain-containing family N member 1 isoform X2 [Corvus hawaiiensis]